MRIREKAIVFKTHPPRGEWGTKIILKFEPFTKEFRDFHLRVKKGVIHEGEVVGVLGSNATGKTTFVKVLAGVLEPTEGRIIGG